MRFYHTSGNLSRQEHDRGSCCSGSFIPAQLERFPHVTLNDVSLSQTMLERGTTKQHPHGQLLPSVSKARVDSGTLLACAQTPGNDEADCAFSRPAPVDSSLDLPWRSLSAKKPSALPESFPECRNGPKAQRDAGGGARYTVRVSQDPSNGLPACTSAVRVPDFACRNGSEEHFTAPGLKVREMNKRAQQSFRQRQKVTQASAQKACLTTVVYKSAQASPFVVQAKLQQQEQDLKSAQSQIKQLQERVEALQSFLTAEDKPTHPKVQAW